MASRRLKLGIFGTTTVLAAGVLAATVNDSFVADPIRLVSVNHSDNTLQLNWDGKGSTYRVELGTDLERPAFETTTTGTALSVDAAQVDAANNGRIGFRLSPADKKSGDAEISGTLILAPAEPAKTKVKKITPQSATVSWRPVDNATAYDVELIDQDPGNAQEVHRVGSETTSFTLAGLEPASKYRVRVRAVDSGVVGQFGPTQKFTTKADASTFRIGAWNICAESCGNFAKRSVGVRERIEAAELDIITVQEAGPVGLFRSSTVPTFTNSSREFALAYGGSKARYIFYRPELFDQLDGGTLSIGNTRTAAWARFYDKTSERNFVVVAVHLSSGKNKQRDKYRSAEIRNLMNMVRNLNTQGDPVILAGDFNTGAHWRDGVFGQLDAGGYVDTARIAKEKTGAQYSSFNGFRPAPSLRGIHIDHVMISRDGFTVLEWIQHVNVVNGKYVGLQPSDHNMISARVRLKANPAEKAEATRAETLSLAPTTRPADVAVDD